MTEGFLSRVALRHEASVQAIIRLLVPGSAGQQHGAAHHLLWALFGDTPERRRDFLWRQTAPGQFMVLSARAPVDRHAIFDIESRPFAPVLKAGDRLRFMLCANATVDRKPPEKDRTAPGRTRSQRHDVVMDALHALPSAERATARARVVPEVMAAWLARQGARTGFVPLDAPEIERCDVLSIPRAQGRARARFGVVDMTGVLAVEDPALFVPALLHGFGRARAFGCGLMLVRRAG
ncbi:type I-E CRISPR-associated protein Cas6/Cse3/CasE [Komagataeibacter medellinensis]|uniref:Type I-E CRISPR-associated protein Cas6/Cse3/CasE n=1 Tax=Komagataeibacter medellinensis TaxID=1177712 RepID=A0ABQ6VZ85_9PROT|nr:type I-E CRISPR-associated protein Cas6/Cse3/CasE [Komagataeibacter medellinensis]KAB8124930.1 type I-E CRISPR-associated protein Cas6/Cse3/CasE [Komagataeibacter medellinensis]